MKKYTAIIGLMLVILVIATGCSKNNNKTTPTPTVTPTVTPVTTPDATGNAILDLDAEHPQKQGCLQQGYCVLEEEVPLFGAIQRDSCSMLLLPCQFLQHSAKILSRSYSCQLPENALHRHRALQLYFQ